MVWTASRRDSWSKRFKNRAGLCGSLGNNSPARRPVLTPRGEKLTTHRGGSLFSVYFQLASPRTRVCFTSVEGGNRHVDVWTCRVLAGHQASRENCFAECTVPLPPGYGLVMFNGRRSRVLAGGTSHTVSTAVVFNRSRCRNEQTADLQRQVLSL